MAVDPEILSLIADIDQILPSPDSPELGVRETETHRVLKRLRTYLISQPPSVTYSREQLEMEITNSIVQAITSQINGVFTDWFTALQGEIEQLQNQRLELVQNFEQLQLIEGLMTRLNEQFHYLQQQQIYASQSLQSLNEYQQQSEQLLIHLDQSFKTVFSTLERDLQGYSQSFSQSLEQMSSLGQQGEAKLMAYLNRLSVQLDQPPLIQPPIKDESPEFFWCLGLEINPQELKAILLKYDAFSCQEFPLFWLDKNQVFYQYSLNEETNLESQLKRAIHENENLILKTIELSEVELRQALAQVTKVVVNRPRVGERDEALVREAIIRSDLIVDTEGIIFQETAIASVLSHLPPDLSTLEPQSVLVIYGGSTFMQLAIVQLEQGLQDFVLSNLSYGAEQMDQDILCQLIYPQWVSLFSDSLPPIAAIIPQVGLGEPQMRKTLQGQLDNHPLGSSLLEAARLTKLILQRQEVLSSEIKGQPWQVQRQELEKTVIQPFLRQLEAHIEDLLTQRNLSTSAVGRVIVDGSMLPDLPQVWDWLRSNFPQSRLSWTSPQEAISRVALGLTRYARYLGHF